MNDDARKTSEADDAVLNLCGLRCPLPALHTQRRLRGMRAGETLVVLADDPLARLDIAHLCATNGHDLIEAADAATATRFRIVRGADPALSGP